MKSYRSSLTEAHRGIPTAIGIRADEKRRVQLSAGIEKLVYPLVDVWPTTKAEVLDWWEAQPFDLGIEEFEGNCLGCFKKSLKKHFLQLAKDPAPYDFYNLMEQLYSDVGPQDGRRVFFRGNLDTAELRRQYEENKHVLARMPKDDPESNGGCSESCEVYPTE